MLGQYFASLGATAAGWSTDAVFLRLILAAVVGTVIGMTREFKNKGAGVKTHVLVCLGSALSMIVSQYILEEIPGAQLDMVRNGAAVISGVGFLGVGTIIVTGKNEVRGLTTAAGLWVCACIGLCAGIGQVDATLLALVFVIFTFTVLSRLDALVHRFSKKFDVYVEFESRHAVKEFLKKLHSWDCAYDNFLLTGGESGSSFVAATLTITLPTMDRKQAFVDAIQRLEFVSFCEEL